MQLTLRVDELDLDAVQDVLADADPETVRRTSVRRDLEPVLRRFARNSLLVALLAGALVGVVLPRRTWPWVIASTLGGGLATTVLLVQAWTTFDETAFTNVRFEGSLERAPEILRTVQRHIEGFEDIWSRVDALALQVGRLYGTAVAPEAPAPGGTAILHVSDVHVNSLAVEVVARLARQFRVAAVVDTGDVTSFGVSIESRIGDLIAAVGVPYYLGSPG